MIVHPFMPSPTSSTSANNVSSMPSAGGISSSGPSSTSEARSDNPGSMLANSFRVIQAGRFTGQQGLLPDPKSPNYSPAGASSTYNSGALNSSLEALLQQVTPPSDEDQARRDQLLLQLLLEKHNDLDSKQSGGA